MAGEIVSSSPDLKSIQLKMPLSVFTRREAFLLRPVQQPDEIFGLIESN